MAWHATLGPNGQLTLPMAVRKALGLARGGRVSIEVTSDGVVAVTAEAGAAPRIVDRAFADLAQETAAQRAAAARGLAALRGGVASTDADV